MSYKLKLLIILLARNNENMALIQRKKVVSPNDINTFQKQNKNQIKFENYCSHIKNIYTSTTHHDYHLSYLFMT